jgi:hypothetical protein
LYKNSRAGTVGAVYDRALFLESTKTRCHRPRLQAERLAEGNHRRKPASRCSISALPWARRFGNGAAVCTECGGRRSVEVALVLTLAAYSLLFGKTYSLLPRSWIAMLMQNRDNLNHFLGHLEVQ